jgi:hypothetical protein
MSFLLLIKKYLTSSSVMGPPNSGSLALMIFKVLCMYYIRVLIFVHHRAMEENSTNLVCL